MRKIKYLSFLLVVALLVFATISNSHQIIVKSVYSDFSTSAKAMCVIEKDSGRVIAGKNENLQLAMASTTKVVTALTVIQNCKNRTK